MDLSDVYTELVMENSRNPANRRELDSETAIKERGYNPSCGDDISLEVELEGDIIKDMAFTGDGCAISLASTSLMIDLLKGKTVEEAQETCELFINMIKREEKDEDKLMDTLGDAYVFQNISNMPSRVKCAVLAWHTLSEILKEK